MNAQNKIEFYMGTQINKMYTATSNWNITNKTKSSPTYTPVLGLNYKIKNINFGLELKFFKVNYSDEFTYKDKFKNNTVISTFKGRFPQISLLYKQQVFSYKRSNLNLISMFNITHNSTPFDEKTLIFGPNTYDFHTQTKSNLGYFYSLSLGLEYKYKISEKYGFFISTQLNSNFDKTLVEENNTIAYPDQTIAYQFLKVNGKSIGMNFGLSYNLSKKNKPTIN